MAVAPVSIFFDVNETLSDLDTVADVFERIGAPRSLAATWFASVLRDGFALTSAGGEASFVDIATTNAHILLQPITPEGGTEQAVTRIMTAFSTVAPHPDVAAGITALRAEGHRLFTLSNGSTAIAKRLLGDAGVLDSFDGILTVDGHTPWKPAREAYTSALSRTDTTGPAYLVAVHPWDLHGASGAGLRTVWISRHGAEYPGHFRQPTTTARGIDDFARQLAALRSR